MALRMERTLLRQILAWNPDGSFRGGQADWLDRVIDDADGSEVARKEKVGEPIAGALQPGTPLEDLLSETERQRMAAIQQEKDRADVAEARVRELEEVEEDRARG